VKKEIKRLSKPAKEEFKYIRVIRVSDVEEYFVLKSEVKDKLKIARQCMDVQNIKCYSRKCRKCLNQFCPLKEGVK